MAKKRKTFENLIIEAVDEALASLGESSKQSIYFHLENKFKIARKDIPCRLNDFAKGLEEIFGLGAQFIEILITKRLYEKIGRPLKWNQNKELEFIEYVEAARKSFLKSKDEAKTIEI
ncbi:hypothetical protein HXY32_01715 [Candidatus Bathyarchaeota archaeon]|nr:hypothetical protein [Candidatus Bathyarchaeota archaeon]